MKQKSIIDDYGVKVIVSQKSEVQARPIYKEQATLNILKLDVAWR